jgi:4,5-DOPA dioxygenase extradiol
VHTDIVLPRLNGHQIRDVDCSALEFAGRGTDETVLLTLAVDRLAVDHDDADLAGLEFAARVQGPHQILAVARDRAELLTGLVSNSPGEPLMPAAFVGHGSPMNALEVNRYTAAWRRFGATLPRPRVILVVSAHWYINATAVTAMPKPRTIHDFYGFPDELFDVDYPAPGLPTLAEEIAEVAHPTWVGADIDSWGIDHGTWSVLTHAFPDASIPVVQLSINADKPFDYHLDLGARLAPLRARGVLILGSGNIVHNLAGVQWALTDSGFDWAIRFDEAARTQILQAPAEAGRLTDHEDFRLAVPTPDHFIPSLYFAGLAADADETPRVLVDGYTYGSLSMTSYTLGADIAAAEPDQRGAPSRSPEIPAEQTNI